MIVSKKKNVCAKRKWTRPGSDTVRRGFEITMYVWTRLEGDRR